MPSPFAVGPWLFELLMELLQLLERCQGASEEPAGLVGHAGRRAADGLVEVGEERGRVGERDWLGGEDLALDSLHGLAFRV